MQRLYGVVPPLEGRSLDSRPWAVTMQPIPKRRGGLRQRAHDAEDTVTTHTATSLAPFDEMAFATTPRQRFALGGGWLTVILALAMLLSMSGALSAAGWSENLDLIQAAIVAGALLSLLLALTRWDAAFSVGYSLLASIVVTVSLLHQGFFPDLTLHDAILAIIQRNVAWISALIMSGARRR